MYILRKIHKSKKYSNCHPCPDSLHLFYYWLNQIFLVKLYKCQISGPGICNGPLFIILIVRFVICLTFNNLEKDTAQISAKNLLQLNGIYT